MKSLYKKIQKYSISVLILLFSLLSIALLSPTVRADVQTGIPAIINGLKTFTGGIKIGTDPNNAWLSNGNITAKTIYSNGNIVPTLDANSHVADSAVYDKHTNLDANSIGLGVAKDPSIPLCVDPNSDIYSEIGKLRIGYFGTGYENLIGLAHKSMTLPNYNILLSSKDTILNALSAGGGTISCRNNGIEIARINNNGLAMSAGKTITQDGVTQLEKAVSLSADPNNVMTDPNSYYTLPTGVAGKLTIWNNTGEARYHVSSTGVITLDKQDSGFNDSYVKGYICAEDAGSGGRVHNCTEAVDKVGIKFEYFTP